MSLRDKEHKLFDTLPKPLQRDIIDHLQTVIGPEVQDQIIDAIKKDPEGWASLYHFGWGMWIRNSLRENVCLDKDLPIESRNWDDLYIAGVERAVSNEISM